MGAAKRLAAALRQDGEAKVIADSRAGKAAERPAAKNPDHKGIPHTDRRQRPTRDW